MMEWAESVMQLHADRKSVLEVSRLLTSPSGQRYCGLINDICVSRWSSRARREPVLVPRWSFMLWWLQSSRERHSEYGCVTTTFQTMSHDR